MQEINLKDNPWPRHMFSVINEPIELKTNPKILVIIPSKDRNDLLFQCIDSIITHTSKSLTKVHVRIVDTGSTENTKIEIDEYVKANLDGPLYIDCDYQGFYNFAKNNNKAFKTFGKGMDYVVFCNNDIKFLNDVLSHMVSIYETEENVGTVGARLHFGDGKLQHIGVFCHMQNGLAAPGHFGFSKAITGSILDAKQKVPGNTCALMMIPAKLFDRYKFSEEYQECFEDVQLNLQVAIGGSINYCNLSAVAFHYESQSRNENPEKDVRQQSDLRRLSKFIEANKSNKFIKEVVYV